MLYTYNNVESLKQKINLCFSPLPKNTKRNIYLTIKQGPHQQGINKGFTAQLFEREKRRNGEILRGYNSSPVRNFCFYPPKFHNADKGPAIEEYSRNQEEFDAAFHAVIGSLKSEDLTLYWILYDNDNENARYKVSTYFMFVT